MNYNPEAKKPVLIMVPGDYPAEVIKAEEKVSKAGNPMMVVELRVHNLDTGMSKFITDYITTGGQYPQDWKLKNLAQSCGLPVNGDLKPSELAGLSCKVKVKIKPAKGGYDEGNSIADYLDTGATAPVRAPAANDSIPF